MPPKAAEAGGHESPGEAEPPPAPEAAPTADPDQALDLNPTLDLDPILLPDPAASATLASDASPTLSSVTPEEEPPAEAVSYLEDQAPKFGFSAVRQAPPR